jgi:hypothetical protein
VPSPVILRHVPQRGVDASLRRDGVTPSGEELGDARGLESALGCGSSARVTENIEPQTLVWPSRIGRCVCLGFQCSRDTGRLTQTESRSETGTSSAAIMGQYANIRDLSHPLFQAPGKQLHPNSHNDRVEPGIVRQHVFGPRNSSHSLMVDNRVVLPLSKVLRRLISRQQRHFLSISSPFLPRPVGPRGSKSSKPLTCASCARWV